MRLLLLIASVSVFADSHRPDLELPDCYPRVYNAPANVDVACGWDLFARSSAIYWRVSQDYMDAGRSAQFSAGGAIPAVDAKSVYPDFSYKPGFKVGLGAESIFDHWSLLLEYTWLHQKTSHSTGPFPSAIGTGEKIWIPNDWFNTLSTSAPAAQAAQINNDWKMHLDQFDLLFTLPFYESPSGIIYHYGGLRSVWIRQTYTIEALLAEDLAAPPAISVNSSKSWSIGPVVGIAVHSLFKWGFHFEGMTKFSLLYTRFTELFHHENDQGFGGTAAIAGSMAPYGCLRPISEFGLGFGWGSYFGCARYHVDIGARYDFNILWNQNMLRQTVGSLADNLIGYANAAGNLYLHGLTVDAALNF